MPSDTQLTILKWIDRTRGEDWNPGSPMELLYLVNQLYPGWIRPSIDSIKLCTSTQNKINGFCWELSVREVDAGFRIATLENVFGAEHAKTLNVIDLDHLLQALWEISKLAALDQQLDFLTDRARSILSDLDRENSSASAEAEEKQQQAKVYLADVGMFLAEALSNNIDLTKSAINRLKSQEPFHVNGKQANSFWDEIVREAGSPSLLLEQYRADARSAVHESFQALSNAEKYAFWLHHQTKSEFIFLVDEALDSYFNEENPEMIGLDNLLDAVADRVISIAASEA